MKLSANELAGILHGLSLGNHKKLLSHLSDLQEERRKLEEKSRKHNPFTTWCIVVIIGIISFVYNCCLWNVLRIIRLKRNCCYL